MGYSKNQLFFLVLLRLFIGWHFLFEGLLKLFSPGWTSQGYLRSAQGFLAPFFEWLGSESMIGLVDAVTMIALTGVGLTVLLGFFERIGAYVGMVLLFFFYLSHPSFPGLEAGAAEGNYFIVNKNLIELAALGVLAYFPTGHLAGLDLLLRPGKTTNQPT